MLAGGQHTPLPQLTGTRIPQLCLPSRSNKSARIIKSSHRRSISIIICAENQVGLDVGNIYRAMKRNVLEESDDCNTFILASSQRKWPRICWKAIGGNHHDQGFETGRIWGSAAAIMRRPVWLGFGLETKRTEKSRPESKHLKIALLGCLARHTFLITRAPRFQCGSCVVAESALTGPTDTTPSPRVAGTLQMHLINGSISCKFHACI